MDETEIKPMAFTARCKDFFGLLPGQSLMDFGREVKSLTLADKEEFFVAFNLMGLPTSPPIGSVIQ